MVGDGIRRYVRCMATFPQVTAETTHPYTKDRNLDEHDTLVYLKWMDEVRDSSEATLASYGRVLRQFLAWRDDRPVTADLIEQFTHRPRRWGITPSASARNLDICVLRSYYKWAMTRGVETDNPTLDVTTVPNHSRAPRAIGDDLWLTLWAADMPYEDRAWLGLGYFAGLRRREIATVPPSCFNLSNEQIVNFRRKGGGYGVVEYGGGTGVVSDKLPWLAASARAWLDALTTLVNVRQGECWLAPRTEHEGLQTAQWTNKRLRVLLGHADLPSTLFSPHALRHSCATNLMRSGVPIEVVADYLGHSSIETTRRYLATGGQLANWRLRRQID